MTENDELSKAATRQTSWPLVTWDPAPESIPDADPAPTSPAEDAQADTGSAKAPVWPLPGTGTGSRPDPSPDPAPSPGDQSPAPDGPSEIPVDLPGSDLRLVVPEGAPHQILSGRVSVLALDTASVQSIRIVDHPDVGALSVNPDNTLALTLTGSDFRGKLPFSYEVTYKNGHTETVKETVTVAAGPEKAGWGIGDHYMLQTDAHDDLIVESGDIHRKVYISGSDDALTLKDIADHVGLSLKELTEKDYKWFRMHGQDLDLGGTEATALDPEAGMALWYATTGKPSGVNSNWLLIERGYEYEDLGRLVSKGANGESPLHPSLITAWGKGDAPVIHSVVNAYQDKSDNIVISDLALTGGLQHHGGENLIVDGLEISARPVSVQNVDGFTFRNSEIVDVFQTEPQNKGATWAASANRITGFFNKNSDGVLIENSFFDHNGWDDGYDQGLSVKKPQPPSMYSHNVYVQYDSTDVTFRDNVSMRAASFGAQIRGGGFIEDNVFLDNNAALNFLGGNYKKYGLVGNYSLVTDNLVTSGGHKQVDHWEGALTMGIEDGGALSSMIDNIVAHLSNPDDPAEFLEKFQTNTSLKHKLDNPFTDDTIVFNWVGSKHAAQFDERSINTDGLDEAILNHTTIQRFAAAVLHHDTATIADLANYWRGLDGPALEGKVDADAIIAYFQNGFGIDGVDARPDGETLRFVPNALGEGVRWDNRLNWTTEDLPRNGDSIDLGGNWVNYGGTTRIDDLHFGDHGTLRVGNGYLEVAGEVTASGATLVLDGAGQFWTHGLDAEEFLFVDVEGGRFANTGAFHSSAGLTASGDGQAILATGGASFDLEAGATLEIDGGLGRVGFDGANGGHATLRLDDASTVHFVADKSGIGTIGEFRSGRFGDNPNVTSSIDLGDATLELDLKDYKGTGRATLIEADKLLGDFGDIEVRGLSSKEHAAITIDYATDTIGFQIRKGAGPTEIIHLGDPADTSDHASAPPPSPWGTAEADAAAVDAVAAPSLWLTDPADPLPVHHDTLL